MIPDCIDPMTNPIVQDCLRRRDETIEVLLEEIKETEKLRDHYKKKLEEKEDEIKNREFKKGWLWGLTVGLAVAIILYFYLGYFTDV